MRKKDDIIQAIRENDRKDKVYVHPVLSLETAAKYISAFANGNGGDIILGISDDGINLHIKKYKFAVQLEKAKKLLNVDVECIVDNVQYNGELLPYISINKSKELVKVQEIPYIFNKNREVVEMKIHKVFLSYSHADRDLADLVEKSLNSQKEISVSRDINVNDYRDDLDEFMKTIRQHDFIVSIVTRKYLTSLNCMYEITESMKDSDFSKKLLFIVIDKEDAQFYTSENIYDMEAGIYDSDKRLDYVIHWDKKYRQMKEKLKNADLPYEFVTEYTMDIRKLVSIVPSASQFMNLLKNKIGSTFNQIQKDDFKILIDVIREK
ncbi:TIR domain-containing protein [Lederbergia lenta]|uniref:TIR domain-containing protein n=1 Tax=Lederbergia lenta TaxID=1467 RepID=UPI00203C9B04|nr:TIR domain-containing protein [Lederbergia lenta]MCM3112835.1 TIR domain-containing protein [Lederbergia lenta]